MSAPADAPHDAPLVTFALFAYNQEHYIAQALAGALSQDYSPLEIVVSDDASHDRTYQVACEILDGYDGPHSIVLNRNPRNLGLGGHVNAMMRLASGRIIVAAAADDISRPDRVSTLVQAFQRAPEPVYSVWSGARYIDEAGVVLDKAFPGQPDRYTDRSFIRNDRPLIGATHAWRAEVFEQFGPLLDEVVYEDNAISFRSFLLGPIVYVPDTLVDYRYHPASISHFPHIKQHAAKYAAAAKKCRWDLIGIQQRQRDLAHARKALPHLRHDFQLMHRELERLQRIQERRLQAYSNFPRVSMHSVGHGLGDAKIARAVLRGWQATCLRATGR